MTRCKNHLIPGIHIGCKSCQECGKTTYGEIVLCYRCAKYLDQCEICREPAGTDIDPALVKAYNAPVIAKIRMARKTASDLMDDIDRLVGNVTSTALLTCGNVSLQGPATKPNGAYPAYVDPICKASGTLGQAIGHKLCQIMEAADAAIGLALEEAREQTKLG